MRLFRLPFFLLLDCCLGYTHLLDTAAHDGQHPHAQPIRLQLVAWSGHAAKLMIHESAQRIEILALDLEREELVQLL